MSDVAYVRVLRELPFSIRFMAEVQGFDGYEVSLRGTGGIDFEMDVSLDEVVVPPDADNYVPEAVEVRIGKDRD